PAPDTPAPPRVPRPPPRSPPAWSRPGRTTVGLALTAPLGRGSPRPTSGRRPPASSSMLARLLAAADPVPAPRPRLTRRPSGPLRRARRRPRSPPRGPTTPTDPTPTPPRPPPA